MLSVCRIIFIRFFYFASRKINKRTEIETIQYCQLSDRMVTSPKTLNSCYIDLQLAATIIIIEISCKRFSMLPLKFPVESAIHKTNFFPFTWL